MLFSTEGVSIFTILLIAIEIYSRTFCVILHNVELKRIKITYGNSFTAGTYLFIIQQIVLIIYVLLLIRYFKI